MDTERDALRMFRVGCVGPLCVGAGAADVYLLARSVPVLLRERASDALRVDKRDAGGAYWLGGRGG